MVAPPAAQANARGWDVCLIPTPAAVAFFGQRRPGELAGFRRAGLPTLDAQQASPEDNLTGFVLWNDPVN
jgi:hypothetical protein